MQAISLSYNQLYQNVSTRGGIMRKTLYSTVALKHGLLGTLFSWRTVVCLLVCMAVAGFTFALR
jgi:hypothetical protein